jgi:hypothetical protein
MRWLPVLLLLGCSRRPSSESLGLPVERVVSVDVKHLDTPTELVHALQLTGAQLDRILGARRMEARSSLKVEPPSRPVEKLEESYRADSDGQGALHLVHDNARDGLEAIVAGGTLYVRPRYGQFTRRRPEGDDVARLRENVESVAAAYLELIQRWLLVKELGRAEVNGRPAVRLQVSATGSPSLAPPETLAYRKWRDTVKVRYASGEWLLDAASGAPLSGKLEASWSFERSDLQGPVAVTLEYEQHGAAPQPIVAPPDAAEARRPRPLVDRDLLLDGLAPARPGH